MWYPTNSAPPTWVEDITRAIELLLSSQHSGIYHICGSETLSVTDIAHRVAKHFKLDESLIQSVTTEEMNEATPRPLYSPMNTEKAFRELGYEPSLLKEGLREWNKKRSAPDERCRPFIHLSIKIIPLRYNPLPSCD